MGIRDAGDDSNSEMSSTENSTLSSLVQPRSSSKNFNDSPSGKQENATLMFLVIKVIASLNHLSSSGRLACHDELTCGDIMLSSLSNIPRAVENYCSAITILSQGNIVTDENGARDLNNIVNPLRNAYSPMEIQDCISSALHVANKRHWSALQYWTLRKLLVCCRILEDSYSFVLVALEVLKFLGPISFGITQSTEELVFRKQLQQDIEHHLQLLNNINTEKTSSSVTTVKYPIVIPVSSLMSTKINYTTKLRDPDGYDRRSICVLNYSELSTPLVTHSFTISEGFTVDVELTSHLPSAIIVDEISIVFRLLVAKDDTRSSAPSPHSLQLVDETLSASYEGNEITIYPGKQTLSFIMRPSRLGDYTYDGLSICVRKNYLHFFDDAEYDMEYSTSPVVDNSVPFALRNRISKEIIKVTSGDRPLLPLILEVPPVSPANQNDTFMIKFEVDHGDTVSHVSLEISLESGASFCDSLLSPPDSWNVTLNGSVDKSFHFVKGTLFWDKIQNGIVCIRCPFSTRIQANEYESECKLRLRTSLRAELLRVACTIPVETQSNVDIVVRQLLSITSGGSSISDSSAIFDQIIVHNISSTDLEVVSMTVDTPNDILASIFFSGQVPEKTLLLECSRMCYGLLKIPTIATVELVVPLRVVYRRIGSSSEFVAVSSFSYNVARTNGLKFSVSAAIDDLEIGDARGRIQRGRRVDIIYNLTRLRAVDKGRLIVAAIPCDDWLNIGRDNQDKRITSDTDTNIALVFSVIPLVSAVNVALPSLSVTWESTEGNIQCVEVIRPYCNETIDVIDEISAKGAFLLMH